jgi:hypothetical protein
MKIKHYLDDDRSPIKDFTIAKECNEMLLPTEKKKEIWNKIIEKLKSKIDIYANQNLATKA